MPFFQGAYDFDISGPVQMNDGSAVGHVFGRQQPPVASQETQKATVTPQSPSSPPPQAAAAPATAPSLLPGLIPAHPAPHPQYYFPGNPQPYILVYAPVPIQGAPQVPVPLQAGFLPQPAQAFGVPYMMAPQDGYHTASYLTPTQMPNGLNNRSANTSASPSIHSDPVQQTSGTVLSPSFSPALLTPSVPMTNGSSLHPPLSSNGANHSAASIATAPQYPVPGPQTPATTGTYPIPGNGFAPISARNTAAPVALPPASPLPQATTAMTVIHEVSKHKKKKSWFSRLGKKS